MAKINGDEVRIFARYACSKIMEAF